MEDILPSWECIPSFTRYLPPCDRHFIAQHSRSLHPCERNIEQPPTENKAWGFPGGSAVENLLPGQETWGLMGVWSPIQEDSTCRGATKPVFLNYWACSLEPRSCNYCTHILPLLRLSLWSPWSTKREALAMRSPHTTREQPVLATTTEESRTAMKTQHSQKINK